MTAPFDLWIGYFGALGSVTKWYGVFLNIRLVSAFLAIPLSSVFIFAGDNATEPTRVDSRVFGVLPNYRTADGTKPFSPIDTRRKLHIAAKDSFDYPMFFLAGFYAAIGQLQNSNPSLGQGLGGYAQRYVRGYGDVVIGNFLTEGLLPSFLHEDPRYFRIGPGGGSRLHRTTYALTRVLVTKTDSGGRRFNFSEVLGNAAGVGIANAYYPDSRNLHDNLNRLGVQIGTDAASNVLKEFWPDIRQKMFHRQ